jgi:uncharacterized protein YcbX
MAGEPLDSATLGFHGLEGDRRYAFRRLTDRGGFPWLSASRLPDLILYRPFGIDPAAQEPTPTHVRTPEGRALELRGEALCEHVSRRVGAEVELMHLKNGIFDDAAVSVITTATMRSILDQAGHPLDQRRFRPNIVIETDGRAPFEEDGWIGKTLRLEPRGSGAAIGVTLRDLRCVMINLDPDTAEQNADVMKAAVRMNGNNAGVYGSVLRVGEIRIGQSVVLEDA